MTDPSGVFEATAMPDRDWWSALWPDPGKVLAEVGLRPGARAVDLGCGDGWFTRAMAELACAEPGAGEVTAIDLDPAMLAAAEAELAGSGAPVRFVRADMLDASAVVTDPVDFALIANTFHGAPDKPALARAVRTLLAPGGRFVAVNWWPSEREQTPVLGQPRGPRPALRFAPEQVAAWVEPAGFRLVEVREVGPYHYGAVFEAIA